MRRGRVCSVKLIEKKDEDESENVVQGRLDDGWWLAWNSFGSPELLPFILSLVSHCPSLPWPVITLLFTVSLI